MLLIIEGISGSGKSSLIDTILQDTRFSSFSVYGRKAIDRNPKVKKIYSDYRKVFELAKDENIIVDRLHLSEKYFGKTYRGTHLNQVFVEKLISEIKHLLIFIPQDVSVCLKRIENRKRTNDLISLEDLENQNRFMNKYYNESKLKKIKLFSESTDIIYSAINF